MWSIVRKSFHGAFRKVEIGEASAAVSLHGLSYFFEGLEHQLKLASLIIAGLFIVTFIFGLVIAAYVVDKEKNELFASGITLGLDQIIIGEAEDGSRAIIVVIANVSNTGEPSVVEGYSLSVTLLNGTTITPSQQGILPGLSLSTGRGQRIVVPGENPPQEQLKVFGPEHALYERTLSSPVAKGNRVRGVLMFSADNVKRDDLLGATFKLTCRDIRNREHSARFTIAENKPSDFTTSFAGLK